MDCASSRSGQLARLVLLRLALVTRTVALQRARADGDDGHGVDADDGALELHGLGRHALALALVLLGSSDAADAAECGAREAPAYVLGLVHSCRSAACICRSRWEVGESVGEWQAAARTVAHTLNPAALARGRMMGSHDRCWSEAAGKRRAQAPQSASLAQLQPAVQRHSPSISARPSRRPGHQQSAEEMVAICWKLPRPLATSTGMRVEHCVGVWQWRVEFLPGFLGNLPFGDELR
jgi:hypothetical protein